MTPQPRSSNLVTALRMTAAFRVVRPPPNFDLQGWACEISSACTCIGNSFKWQCSRMAILRISGKMPTTPEARREFTSTLRRDDHLVLEATGSTYPIVQVLKQHADRRRCARCCSLLLNVTVPLFMVSG